MPIDADEVRHIARLAHLDLDPPTVERFRHQLQAILDYVAMLDALDVSRIPPTAHTLDLAQPLREDEAVVSFPREAVLSNAPDAAEGHFRVPQVLKE